MGKEIRSKLRHFINSTPTDSADAWELLNLGITDLTMNYNPNVEDEHYVGNVNSTKSIIGYAPEIPIEISIYTGDDAYDYLDSLRQGGPATGSSAETEVVEVRTYEDPDTAGTSYPATKWSVAVSFESIGGPGNESGKINCTLNITGDPTEGDFNTTTLAFTADS
jgi:hypothetical protein